MVALCSRLYRSLLVHLRPANILFVRHLAYLRNTARANRSCGGSPIGDALRDFRTFTSPLIRNLSILLVLSGLLHTLFSQIPPNNLGQIVEVATPAGILPVPHLLIGWDSTGFIRQANSTDSFKVFGIYPDDTNLNQPATFPLNQYKRFSAPSGHDSYEIRYSDSSHYWQGSTLAAGKLPFAVYSVGARSSRSQDTSVAHRLCIQRHSAGYYVIFSDMALPWDSTYWEMGTRSTIPFSSVPAVIRNLRTGRASIPYTQSTWNETNDAHVPSPGTVIRLVAANADTASPIVSMADTAMFGNSSDSLALQVYSFEPVTLSLTSAPDNMLINPNGVIYWHYTTQQIGTTSIVTVSSANTRGTTYSSFVAVAGLDCNLRVDDSVVVLSSSPNNMEIGPTNRGLAVHSLYTGVGYSGGFRFSSQQGHLLYSGGFYFGTKKRGAQGQPDTVVVSHAEFINSENEFQPGRILNSGSLDSLLFEDPNSPNLGVYVLPDREGCWPDDAPHRTDGDPLQISGRDTWAVCNDISPLRNSPNPPFDLSPRLGLEIQRQTFMFGAYPWNNAMLVRLKIINKSATSYDSCFVGLFEDPDVGVISVHDLSAVDSSLSMQYAYSDGGDPEDVAVGTVLLQGPLAAGGAQDTAWYVDIGSNGFAKGIAAGKIVRMAYAAMAIRPGNNDPSGLEDDLTRYNFLIGLNAEGIPKPGGPLDDGPFGQTSGNQRTILSSGPFTFAAGDTQDIWYAYVGAIGANDLAAVDTLKNYAALMHQTFQGNMNDIVVGIGNSNTNAVVHDLRLYSNYPNPFNPSTTIKYVLPKASRVSLKIYNILGQEVRTLVNARQSLGEHSVIWDGKNKLGKAVSSGVYLYRLEVDGKVKVKKMMVLK